MNVSEMRMTNWIRGKTRKNMVRNERSVVAPIQDKNKRELL